MNNLQPIVNELKKLKVQQNHSPQVQWAVIHSVSPLRIRLDEDTLPLEGTPQTLVNPELLEVGMRVEVILQNNRAIIQGIGGGATVTPPGSPPASAYVPVGSVTAFAGSTAPSGWLLCQGQEVSRSTYAALFSVLGTTYGVGDGSSTFNVPDLRGRVPVGVATSDTEFNSLGKKSGAKTHTLTVAEMPSHNHRVVASGRVWTDSSANLANGSYHAGLLGAPNTGNTGGGGAHNNIQPSIALNFIIRAL